MNGTIEQPIYKKLLQDKGSVTKNPQKWDH
jgi:hypothetical protein